MSRDKQIDEMGTIIATKAFERAHEIDGDENLADIVATELYDKGYRKVDEDYARQCTCYALGCQMAEQLEKKVASEIFGEIINRLLSFVYLGADGQWHTTKKYASKLHSFVEGCIELKKKYTEEGK